MIKLTQILNESESNLSYLDNKVYRKDSTFTLR